MCVCAIRDASTVTGSEGDARQNEGDARQNGHAPRVYLLGAKNNEVATRRHKDDTRCHARIA